MPDRADPSALTRRGLIGATAALAAGPVAAQQPLSLKAAAWRGGLLYGAAMEPENLERDVEFARLVQRQCAVLVPENVMKWTALRPGPGAFDFDRADRLMAIARRQRALAHGHCLIWHEAMPDWLQPDRDNAEDLLTEHIRTVVGRYAGRIRSWDVVNEVVERNDRGPDGLRDSPWMRALGPRYLELAFHTAHAADPSAHLALADYGLEYDDERWMVEKRGTMLEVLARLIRSGAPIHALALQGHLDGSRRPAFGAGLRRFLAEVAAMGLEVYVTELDVNDQNLAGDPARRDVVIADCYRAFLEVICDEPALRMVNTWGLSDRYTSKSTLFARADGAGVRPLPFDDGLAPKRAAQAMAAAFARRAPKTRGS